MYKGGVDSSHQCRLAAAGAILIYTFARVKSAVILVRMYNIQINIIPYIPYIYTVTVEVNAYCVNINIYL